MTVMPSFSPHIFVTYQVFFELKTVRDEQAVVVVCSWIESESCSVHTTIECWCTG